MKPSPAKLSEIPSLQDISIPITPDAFELSANLNPTGTLVPNSPQEHQSPPNDIGPTNEPVATRNEIQRGLLAIAVALISSVFFTLTYIFNRMAAIDGGNWAWTACLRYLITLPLLLPLMPWQGGVLPVLRSIGAHPWVWLRCSVIGFLLFYTALAFASSSGPAWLVAGSFQFTIIAGMLCAPLIYRDARRHIPVSGIVIGMVIVFGVLLMQFGQGTGALDITAWLALICVLTAATAYPVGNRLLLLHLEKSGEQLSATQRVFGMTLITQPFWLLMAAFAWSQSGPPPASQVVLAAGVALSAGVIATILFFQATGMVRHNPIALGATEAMQAAEILIAILLGVMFLNEAWPQGMSLTGAFLVMLGIVVFTVVVARSAHRPAKNRQ